MPYGNRLPIPKLFIILAVLLFASTGIAFAQAGWKTAQEMGYTFSYPSDWNYLDLGGEDYEGTKGYTRALSPPGESNFIMVVMLFPKFKVDLKAEKMTYKDFVKTVFESFLKEGDLKDLAIEETDSVLKKGKVPAFMVLTDNDSDKFQAAMICGDLVKGNAAILMVTMELQAEQVDTGKEYLDTAEKIMASFAFPK
jgi:hypothetical protein